MSKIAWSKKISRVLLLIICLQSGGLLTLYAMQQYFIQQYMLRELSDPDAKPEILVLSKDDFDKSRIKRHEVMWEGKMYDINSLKMRGDTVELMVIHDEEEESVLKEIRNLLRHAQGHEGNSLQLFGKLSSVIYQGSVYILPGPFTATIHETLFVIYDGQPFSGYAVVAPLPPEFLFISV